MSYVCDWTLELPVQVNGITIAWCPDIDVKLVLDDEGQLFKVLVPLTVGEVLPVFAGTAFEIAKEAVEAHRNVILDRAVTVADPIDTRLWSKRMARRLEELGA